MECLSGSLFLLFLHLTIWMKWAKLDYDREKRGMKMFFSKRTFDLTMILVLTFWSILEVNYWYPKNIVFRILVDTGSVGLIVWYRFFVLPKNQKNQKSGIKKILGSP